MPKRKPENTSKNFSYVYNFDFSGHMELAMMYQISVTQDFQFYYNHTGVCQNFYHGSVHMFIILILVVITCPDPNRDGAPYYLFYSFFYLQYSKSYSCLVSLSAFAKAIAEATRRRSVFKH